MRGAYAVAALLGLVEWAALGVVASSLDDGWWPGTVAGLLVAIACAAGVGRTLYG